MSTDISITDIPGILVGHAADHTHHTGCTAVLCPEGLVGGVDICGFAPGGRETELLKPRARVEEIHGILLSGGSAFGLAAATGMVRWLAERGYGLDTGFARVPLVAGAVIYDLNFNQSLSLPDEAMGYAAAEKASSDPVGQGCIGAGTGATCGKLAGFDRAMKSGLGSFGLTSGDIMVAAMAVVNPVGDVVDPDTGTILAGVRSEDGKRITGSGPALRDIQNLIPASESHTVLGLVATNAAMTKLQTNRVAKMASVGIGRAVRPAHLLYDGDTVFALASKKGPEADENIVGALAAEALARAVAQGAKRAVSLPGFPSFEEMVSSAGV